MKVRLQATEQGTVIVTRLDMGQAGGFQVPPAVEVQPGQRYGGHPYRRLKRWAGTEPAGIEREINDDTPRENV